MMAARDEARCQLLNAPIADGWRFDPVALIAGVNSLVGLDESSAVELLGDTLAPGIDATRVGLVARLLFEPDSGAEPLPAPPFGRPDMPLPAADRASPFLPLLFSADVPFLLVGGYLGGGAVDLAGWLERCAVAGTVRDESLRPGRSPVDAVDALTSSERWADLVMPGHRSRASAMVRGQALRAAGAAPEEAGRIAEALLGDSAAESEQRWLDEAEQVQGRDLRWDEHEQRFCR